MKKVKACFEKGVFAKGIFSNLRMFVLFALLGSISYANAQKIGGVIVDEFDEPLIGASVQIKGTTVGTVTDFDGNFEITVSGQKDVLVFSYLGYQNQEVTVGKNTTLRIKMEPDNEMLEEVVVTAMGIEKKAKSLTYATQSVSGAELTRAKDSHLATSLQGKMAGLVITPNSSGAGGGSSKITLRGQTSLLGNNDALIVIDGIPMSNGASGQVGVADMVYSGGRDGGDPLSNINSDDIASVTVLKGANAAALYGSKANNGVVLITTKTGREGAVRVDLSSNTTFETPLCLPKLQNTYGGTLIGNSTTGYQVTSLNWNKKKMSDYTAAEKQQYSAYMPYFTTTPQDNIGNYFKLGTNFNNTISINGGSENAQSYFSYGNTTANGIQEGNTFSRHNLFFKQNFLLFNKYLKIDLSANYINQKVENSPTSGEGFNPLYAIYKVGRDVDMRYFRANYARIATTVSDYTINQRIFHRLKGQEIQNWAWGDENYNNPYWLLNKTFQNRSINRLILNGSANVKIIDGLNAQVRFSRDQTDSKNEVGRYATAMFKTVNSSYYYVSQDKNVELFTDFIITFNRTFADVIDVNATVGGSYNQVKSSGMTTSGGADTAGLVNYFAFDNWDYWRSGTQYEGHYDAGYSSSEWWSDNWNAGAFASVQVGLWDKAYIDASYRHDWSKAFQQFRNSTVKIKDENGNVIKEKPAKTSFGYYSVGANFLLKDLFNITNKKINMMKLRASYSEVGNSIPNSLYGSYTFNPVTGTYSGASMDFDDPQPETTRSFEAGYDMALFNNALDFDITYYYSVLSNQYLSTTTQSGVSRPINSGQIRNTGVEFTINYNWNITKDFSWKTGFNFSYNANKILSTYDDGKEYSMGWDMAGFLIKFKPGASYGDLYTRTFNRDDNGVINTTSLVGSAIDHYAGNTMSPFFYGWNNTFTYKDFSFYFLLDGKIGGKVLSYTQAKLDYWGVSEATGVDRNGYIQLPDRQYVSVEKYYQSIGTTPTDNYVYDASNLRLRELSVGYTFRNLLGNSKNLSLSFVARNLCFLYKAAPIDPDISSSTQNGAGGIDAFSFPTTRSYGLNIKVTF